MILLLFISGCQHPKTMPKKTEPSHVRRGETVIIGDHENKAQQFPQHYIIEGPFNNKTVALTFDDGPSEHTLSLLNVLKKHHVKATFFMLGNQMQQYPKIVQSVVNNGHEIANHSWDHDDMLNYKNIDLFWQNQVNKQIKITQKIIGKTPRLFRPPFGRISSQQVQFLAQQNIKTIIWSIDTQDWNEQTNSVNNLVKAATQYMHPEAIILMHDGGGNRKNTVKSLAAIINHYTEHGYQFVTVSDLLNTDAYHE